MTSVWDPHPEYEERLQSMQLACDLLSGTEAMRGGTPLLQTAGGSTVPGNGGGTRWLLRFSGDSDDSFWARWHRAYLFAAFRDAVDRVVGKVFSDQASVEALPEDLVAMDENCDREGTSFHRFAARHFSRVVAFGGSGILVSMPGKQGLPSTALAPDGNISETARRTYDVRPYFVSIHRLSVIDWEWKKRPDGGRQLSLLKIRGDDRYEIRNKKRVCVQRLDVYELVADLAVTLTTYEKIEGDTSTAGAKAGEVPTGPAQMLDVPEIPFVFDAICGPDDEDDPFAVDLPMSELAWLNLQHFRETAEQGVALANARAEGLVEWGCEDDPKKLNAPINWTAGRAKRTTQPPGSYDLKFVGPSGKGVELGENSLAKIEERMARLGAQPLTRGSGNATATAASLDEASTDTSAAAWARGTEDAFERAFRIADLWQRPTEAIPLDKRIEGLVVSFKGTSSLSAQANIEKLRMQFDVWQAKGMRNEDWVAAMVEGRILPADTDTEELLAWMDGAQLDEIKRHFDMLAAASGMPNGDPNQPPDPNQPTPPPNAPDPNQNPAMLAQQAKLTVGA